MALAAPCVLEFRLSHHCSTTGLLRQSSLPHCLASSPRLEGHRPGDGSASTTQERNSPWSSRPVASWRRHMFLCFCQLALEPLLGPYPQAYTAPQLRNLRRAPGRLDHRPVHIVGYWAPVTQKWAGDATPQRHHLVSAVATAAATTPSGPSDSAAAPSTSRPDRPGQLVD